jgi:hypothetical protein
MSTQRRGGLWKKAGTVASDAKQGTTVRYIWIYNNFRSYNCVLVGLPQRKWTVSQRNNILTSSVPVVASFLC